MSLNKAAADLIKRSNKLGADPTVTNYAGGNTSAKGTEIDPVTGEPVELLWVKGSGGDLGTLTEAGLAVIRLDRFRQLVDVYPGVEREDEMVAAFDYTLHGKGGAAPSIDTAMHGLVDAAHVDHLHPDAGIAIATAKDGEKLTKKIYGDTVVWVPWRRPGFQLGLDIAAIKAKNPQAIGVHPRRARHHGMGQDERGVAEELALDHPHGRGVPRGERQEGSVRQAAQGLRRAAAEGAAHQGGGAGSDDPRDRVARRTHGRALHRLGRRARLPGVIQGSRSSRSSARAAPTTSCARRSSRSSSTCRRMPRSTRPSRA